MNIALTPASSNRGGNSWDYCFLSRKARTNATVTVGFSSMKRETEPAADISSDLTGMRPNLAFVGEDSPRLFPEFFRA
jgi:hypothetical protein